MPGWLSRNTFTASDYIHADDLNNLANDDRTWGGDVNGGGYHLSNVILQGSGGFSSYVSPIEVTPGSTGTTCLQLDQTVGANHVARWTVCKDATAETGSNTGSNFAIARYTDAGVVIDAPIAINRATGLITMGAQQWAGAVNGGGQTLSNVVIPGTLADPTTTKGDILARSASALARVAVAPTDGWVLTVSAAAASGVAWAAPAATGVPTSRQILTSAGISGGGPLTADLNLRGVVFGASGASHATGDVPDPGGTLGATRYLREDATWGVPSGAGGGLTDPTTTKGDIIVRGPAATTRLGVGSDGQVLTADSTQADGIRWGAAAVGGSQTPWLTNIDGNGKTLTNTGNVSIGGSIQGGALTVQASTDRVLNVRGDPATFGLPAGLLGPILQGVNSAQSSFEPITFVSPVNFMLGSVGVGKTTPAYAVDVSGDVNVSGAFRVNGTAIATSQTPWTSNIAAAGFNLTNVSGIGVGTSAPRSLLSIITAAGSTIAGANQITLGESSNSPGYQLAVGFYYNSSSTFYPGVIQTLNNGSGGPLLLNPSGGGVGIHQANPLCALDIVADGPPASSGNQNTGILISSGFGGAGLNLGVSAYGWIQSAYTNNAGTPFPLVLQPVAGSVGIGRAPSYALDVSGDVNCTGAFRVNGTILAGAQTPWTGNVDQAGHTLSSSDAIVRIQNGNMFLQTTQGEIPDAQIVQGALHFFQQGTSALWVKFRDASTGNIVRKSVNLT